MMGGWEVGPRGRRVVRGLVADVAAVAALGVVLALLWWFS